MRYFSVPSTSLQRAEVSEALGNSRFCSDCHAMHMGRAIPHEYLMPAGKPDEEVYRCLLCSTQLQRAGGGTPWEILPAPQAAANSSEPVRR